ncbi:MAG: hypothetical protein IPK80_29635 [Nannocystis sp.]|nr:hypothetical protein [Nannocystis sp.]
MRPAAPSARLRPRRRRHRRSFAALLLAIVAACAPGLVGRGVDPAPEAGPLLLVLERSGCHGACPIYWIRVSDDGAVLYEGQAFVAELGRRAWSLTPSELQQLRALFAAADYFALADRYRRRDYDGLPAVTTTYRRGARQKTIDHYLGDSSAPAALLELEEALDRHLHTARLIDGP